MDRREFLRRAGLIVVAIPAGELLAACGGAGTGNQGAHGADGGTGQTQTFTSTLVGGHTHEVTIAVANFGVPPASGITKTTTQTNSHTHQVSLTQAELKAVHNGQTVTKDTTVNAGHKHSFAFVLS